MSRHAPIAVAFLVAAACESGEPVALAARYTVETVEGAPAPRLIAATFECDVSITGGRLTAGPADQFELGLDVVTDCSRGGGDVDEATYGYTGTALVDEDRVTFQTANAGGPFSFEGTIEDSGTRVEVTVPDLVPLVEDVAVVFVAE